MSVVMLHIGRLHIIHTSLLVLFERRRKYNVPVHMCVHPELSQYFSDVLAGLRALLKEGKLEKVWLSIKNKVDIEFPAADGG